jgi:hypothetical protein
MDPVMHDPPGEPSRDAPGAAPRGRRWIVAVVALVALGAVFWLVRRSTTSGPPAGGRPAAAQARPVPVAAAPAARRDVPVFLEGLGSVVAFRTVTVKPQVDGRLDQIFDALRAGRVNRRAGAVHQDYLGLGCQGPGNTQPLLLPAR